MNKPDNPKRLGRLLAMLIVLAYLVLTVPLQQSRATTFCDPPPGFECIERTVWNSQTCRCECPDQECCDFYWPFVPHGCDGNPLGAAESNSTR